MYNKVIMIGNLTKDIDFRTLSNGSSLAKSTIATSHKYKNSSGENKEEICYLDFSIFGKIAEVANQYLKKGSKVMLEGRLTYETWVGNDGMNRHKNALMVEEMKMLGDKQTSNQSVPSSGIQDSLKSDSSSAKPKDKKINNNDFEKEEDIPF